MKHLFIILSCLLPCLCSAQTFSGEYTAEGQWDMGRRVQHLATGVCAQRCALLRRCGCPLAAIYRRHGWRNAVCRRCCTQDHLRLVGVCRAARVVGCRPLRDVHGAVLGEHLSPKCLLQVCRGGLRLLRQSQPVRIVCSMRSLPSRHRALR